MNFLGDQSRPTFLKPNLDYTSGLNQERLNDVETELELAKFSSFSNLAMETQRKQLPIFKSYMKILYALETSRVVVVVGETGFNSAHFAGTHEKFLTYMNLIKDRASQHSCRSI